MPRAAFLDPDCRNPMTPQTSWNPLKEGVSKSSGPCRHKIWSQGMQASTQLVKFKCSLKTCSYGRDLEEVTRQLIYQRDGQKHLPSLDESTKVREPYPEQHIKKGKHVMSVREKDRLE